MLITGHTGFKGSWLAQMLISLGAEVSGYALAPSTTPNIYSILKLQKQVSSTIADIRDYDKLLSCLTKEKPEIIIHMAAQPIVRASYDDPRYTFDTNVMGTVNVLEAIRNSLGIKSAVMITTDKVYENKEDGRAFTEGDSLGGYDPYSASKAADEIVISSYIRSFFNPASKPDEEMTLIASARAGNVIGGGDWSADRLVPDIVRAKAEGKQLMLRHPEAVRPWQHVLDPLYGYLLLAKGLHEGHRNLVGSYNFAPDESLLGSIPRVPGHFVPAGLVPANLVPDENNFVTVEQIAKKSGVRFVVQPDEKKHEAGFLRLDAGKAKRNLGWKPSIPIDEGLKLTFEWYSRQASGEDMVRFTQKQIDDYLKKAEK